jgi:hypothetical protein
MKAPPIILSILESRHKEYLSEGRITPKMEYLSRMLLNYIRELGHDKAALKFVEKHGKEAFDDLSATLYPKGYPQKVPAATPQAPPVATPQSTENPRIKEIIDIISGKKQDSPLATVSDKPMTVGTPRTGTEIEPYRFKTPKEVPTGKEIVKVGPEPIPENPPRPRPPAPPNPPLLPPPPEVPPRKPFVREAPLEKPLELSGSNLSSAYLTPDYGRVYSGNVNLAGDIRGMSQLAQRWKIA